MNRDRTHGVAEGHAPGELTDELIDAHLSLAYQSSDLNGMTGVAWDRIVARRFYGLGAAVGSGLVPAPKNGVPVVVAAAPPSVASSNTERVVFKCDNPGGCRFPKQPCLASCSLTVSLAPAEQGKEGAS